MKKTHLLIALAVIATALYTIPSFWSSEGNLALAMPGAELQLVGRVFSTVTVRSGSEPTSVPARSYRPRRLTLTEEQGGNTWQLESRGPWNSLGKIKVEPGQTTTVTLGPPLVIRPQVSVQHGQGFVDLAIYGQAGEKYSNVIVKNRRKMPAPAVKILDEEGNILASGRFEYG